MSTAHLKTIELRLPRLSHWMIHNANPIRSKADGIKVGGHQASSASEEAYKALSRRLEIANTMEATI